MYKGNFSALKLNLGAGQRVLNGYVNVDKIAGPGIDVIWDLNIYPWPFADESVEEIVMSHCLEHLDDHNQAMKEIYRILKKGKIAKISVPHFTWQFAYADPTHKHFFSWRTFFYYTGRGGYFDFAFSECRIKIVFGKRYSFWNYLIEPLANLFPDVYEQSPLRIFPAVEIQAILRK